MNATQKLKQAKLYQFNTGEYFKLDKIKQHFLKDSTPLSYLEETTSLDLSKQNQDKMPPFNTLSFYFPNLKEINLSHNKLCWIEPKGLIKVCPNLEKIDLSHNSINQIDQILKFKKLEKLTDLNISHNPIDIIKKRICLLKCLILDKYQDQVTEEAVVKYLTASYSHVARQRPQTAILPVQKKHFPHNTDDKKYPQDILRYVSIEDKELDGILKMTTLAPRQGGNFKYLVVLNNQHITVFELQEILYYEKFPKDYEKQRDYYRLQTQISQEEYQRSTLKKGQEKTVKIVQRPVTSKRKPKERLTNKPNLNIDIESLRPQTVFRFVFQDKPLTMKNQQQGLMSPQSFRQKEEDLFAYTEEKKRIDEERRENKKDFAKIKTQITTLKKVNSIKDFRYKEITKAPTYYPQTPDIPQIQIKAKNIQKDLIEDITKKKTVEKVQTQGKIKVMKRIRQEQQKKLENQDLLNQSFNSEDMNERKDEEAIKLKESSSSEGEEGNQAKGYDDGLLDDEEILQDLESESLKDEIESVTTSPQMRETSGNKKETEPIVTTPFNLVLSPTNDQQNKFMHKYFSTDNLLWHDGLNMEKFQSQKAKFEQKEFDKQNYKLNMRKNFRLFVGKAHRAVFKTRKPEIAQEIVREELFKGHTKYDDLKESQLKMDFVKIMADKNKFRESLDYFKNHKEYLETNPYYKEFYEGESHKKSRQIEINTYEDMVLLYLNCKQNEHRKVDYKKFKRVINKICPTDPESNFKHKKRFVMEKIDKNLLKMDDVEFNRLQNILNLYAKLDSFPPSLKNFDKWLEINQLRQQKQSVKDEIMRKHIESLPQTKEKRLRNKEKLKEEKRVQVSLSNTTKMDNNYFLSPKHFIQTVKKRQESQELNQEDLKNIRFYGDTFTKTQDENIQQLIRTTNETQVQYETNQQKKLSQMTRVGFIEKHKEQGINPITSKKITEEWEPLDMKGSIVDYIPQYNKFWNELKQKVFPLGSLEQIIHDPQKYLHTKKVLQEEFKKQEKVKFLKRQMQLQRQTSTKTLKAIDDLGKKVIGSKYRIITTKDQLAEPKKVIQKADEDVNISDYLDDVCEDSTYVEKKVEKKGEDRFYHDLKVSKFQKNMEKEHTTNPIAHQTNMLGRIVRYSHNKYLHE